MVANGVLKNVTADETAAADNRFVKMAEKFIKIEDLDIDLIDKVNPFQMAYEILSKSVTTDVLKRIHETITAKKIPMTEEEAVLLFLRIKDFKRVNNREPTLTSSNPMEKRLAEALAWIREEKKKRLRAEQAA